MKHRGVETWRVSHVMLFMIPAGQAVGRFFEAVL